ncbi:general substrate transporter [Microdochium bolleyi]|uniref:General substrate transporter n=1 Tax=Microdochium bolleyi TaxID=196109 RepID=A0A136IZI4_9PEZI|nr:general substrate transporter [Microdochium bolleyi]
MPFPPSRPDDNFDSSNGLISKKTEIVIFSSTAIALYGYDQGMMSMVNTNYSYLSTMGISGTSPIVGIIVSVYYLGCTAGAVLASRLADARGRKPAIFGCLATCVLGNLLMAVAGLSSVAGNVSSTWPTSAALACMLAGRVVLGLGVGGIDAVIPVYSAELAKDGGRGKALAQEFQMNIFGLLLAFAINLGATFSLGKENQWAWRTPIVCMQVFPLLLISAISRLPESPRWFVSQDRASDARDSLMQLHGGSQLKADDMLEELQAAADGEADEKISYADMLLPSGPQYHPTMLTVMGQVNQALTGYGAVSVYGPQIFELLGFSVTVAEWTTLGNFVSYFLMMTVSWMTIDVLGRRKLMVWGAAGLAGCFLLLALFGGLAMASSSSSSVSDLAVEILGSITLFTATAIFGICWLATVWLIPTEIYPSAARAQGSAVSVIVWGVANFAITLLTPILFNNAKYWLFLVFAVTNSFAGWWTWKFSPETGGRSFEENQEFFEAAGESWAVHKVDGGRFLYFPREKDEDDEEGSGKKSGGDGERQPLLRSS